MSEQSITQSHNNQRSYHILGFGAVAEVCRKTEHYLKSQGHTGQVLHITNDISSDQSIISTLQRSQNMNEIYDCIVLGNWIHGQTSEIYPANKQSTEWLLRVLNIIHRYASRQTRIVFAMKPQTIIQDIEQVMELTASL